jgi:hypothetical protein
MLQEHIRLALINRTEGGKLQRTGYRHCFCDVVRAVQLVHPQQNPGLGRTAREPCYFNRHSGWYPEDVQVGSPHVRERNQRHYLEQVY